MKNWQSGLKMFVINLKFNSSPPSSSFFLLSSKLLLSLNSSYAFTIALIQFTFSPIDPVFKWTSTRPVSRTITNCSLGCLETLEICRWILPRTFCLFMSW